MATLAQNSSSPPRIVLPSEILLRRHRWQRWRWVMLVLLVGSGLTLAALWWLHPSLGVPDSWEIVGAVWTGGLVVSGFAALLAWTFAPRSLLETARQMDRDFTAKNRLEAIAALGDSDSPLARAQREETAAYLARAGGEVRPGRLLPWLVAALFMVLALHLATLAVWLWPLLHPAQPPPPVPNEPPKATIVWQSPEEQSKANPVEEVPTVAVAESNTGLKNITLEISVNGAPKQSVPIPAQPFDQPGKNTLKVSIYMDQLKVEPFDIVSYYLRGVRVAPQKLPDTVSPIQFIQVRLFRENVRQMQANGSGPMKNQERLMDLKLAELQAVKENFILAHAELPPGDPVRAQENKRVGQDQADLAKKAEEAAQAFQQAGYPAALTDLLRQAEPPMDEAGKKILGQQNDPALPQQQKALSLIVATEKYFQKMVLKGNSPSSSSSPPPPEDPFKDKPQHELADRSKGAAGQLETLAKNQAQLANDLNQPEPAQTTTTPTITSNPAPPNNQPPAPPQPGNNPAQPPPQSPPQPAGNSPPANPSTPPPAQAIDPFGAQSGQGTPIERQTRVVQGIGVLLSTQDAIPTPAGPTAQQAQKEAQDSQHSLAQNDATGAQEPATLAAQALQRAVTQVNQAGEEQTKQAMQESQQQMNDLERHLRDLAQHPSAPDAAQRLADAAQQVQNLQNQLQKAADHQQSEGSAAGAQRLNQLAQNLAEQKIAPNLADMSQHGMDAGKTNAEADKLAALAEQAAQKALAGQPNAQDLEKLVNALEANKANLEHLASPPAGGQPNNPANPSPSDHANGQGSQPSPENQYGQGNQAQQGQDGKGGSGSSGGDGKGQAFRDVMANLKDLAQQADAAHPSQETKDFLQTVSQQSETLYQAGGVANVVHGYDAIAPPLNQLILDLKEAEAHAERDAVIRQPDLNEAPAAFRPAVSDYFESMSKDYHPDTSPKP